MGQVINPAALLIKTDQQPATVAFFNNLINQFCSAINGVGVRMDGYDAAEQNLVNLGLANINSTLGPFLTTLQAAAQLGFLVAEADGRSLSLTVGAPFDMILTSNGASLFTPTKWLMVMDVNDSTNWGVLQLDSWVAQDLNLAAHCIYASKTQTSLAWQVTCGSGVLNAMVNDLNAATAAASTAQSASTSAIAAAATVTAALGPIGTAGVQSINGKTGFIGLLAEGDISGLTADLVARPLATTINPQPAGKQPLSTTLTSLAAITFSTFINAFLGATDANSAIGTLGAAPLASPAFSGTPTAPTPTAGDNSTRLAATAFVTGAIPAGLSAASSATIAAGTDNVQYATAAGIAANYTTASNIAANYVTKSLVVNAQSGTSYTIQASDNGALIIFSNASAITLTCPNNLPANFNCAIEEEGAGIVTVVAAGGGPLASRGSRFKLNGQYAMGFLRVQSNSGTNAAWRLAGDIST